MANKTLNEIIELSKKMLAPICGIDLSGADLLLIFAIAYGKILRQLLGVGIDPKDIKYWHSNVITVLEKAYRINVENEEFEE